MLHGMNTYPDDFAELLAPMPVETFLTEYYGRKPVHIAHGDKPRPDILSWEQFNRALEVRRYWTEPRLRLVMGNKPALTQHYVEKTDTLDGPMMLANPDKVKAFLGLGASLVANQIDGVSPEVHSVARTLQAMFGATVAANVYCSFQNVQAFQTHYDLHDVFAVQTEGEKIWRVYEARADSPTRGLPDGDATSQYLNATRGQLLFEIKMRPGDVLYLPRGQYHDALATSDASLHVTFSVSPLTGLKLFDILKEEVEQESAFRQYMPDARERDGAALREHLDGLAARIAEFARSPAFFEEVRNAQRALGARPADYALPARPEPLFYAATGERAQMMRRDDGYVLRTARGEVPVGGAHKAASWILGQNFFSTLTLEAGFAYLTAGEIKALLDTMTRANLIAQTQPQGVPRRTA